MSKAGATQCKTPDRTIREYASKLNMNPEVLSSVIVQWKGNVSSSEYTFEQLEEYIKDRGLSGDQNASKDSEITNFWETPEEKKKREENKQKAAKIHIRTQKALGACAAWQSVAKLYGIKNISTPEIEEYDALPSDTTDDMDRLYMRVMGESVLNRSWYPIKSERDPKRKNAAKRHRLKALDVQRSDAVYVIGEIIYPGEKSSPQYEGDYVYENKGKVPSVAREHGISVQMAITLGKPVHVFDTRVNKWKTWNREDFVEEETPTLSEKPLLLGRKTDLNISKKGVSFSKTLGKGYQAIIDVFAKTFGYTPSYAHKLTMQGLEVSELGMLRQAVATEASKYKPDYSDFHLVENNPMTKLNLEMNAMERKDRVEMLSRSFSDIVDDLVDELMDTALDNAEEAGTIYSGMKNNKTVDKKARTEVYNNMCYWNRLVTDLEDPDKQRKAVIKHIGLDGIFTRMKEEIAEIISGEEDEQAKAKYQRVYDNFDMLIQEALDKIQYYENFRVIPVKPKGSNKFEAETVETAEEAENLEEQFEDDELGSRVTGNDGWSFKIRFTDPKKTLSAITKRALHSLLMRDYNGQFMKDDLQQFRYMNGEFAHNVLIRELEYMVDADDFSYIEKDPVTGEDVYRFPALEKLVHKFPWVQSLIDKLATDPDLVSAFFHDMNNAYIQYAKMDSKGLSMPLNQPGGLDDVLNMVSINYTNSNILAQDTSVYNTGGTMNRDNAKRLLEDIDYLRNNILDNDIITFEDVDLYDEQGNFIKDSDAYEAAVKLSNILRSLGFRSSDDYVASNMQSLSTKDDEGETKLDTLLTALRSILGPISDPKITNNRKESFTDGSNYLLFFNKELKKVARLIGEMTEFEPSQSFRDGDKSRYSYSAPNYIINMVKTIKSDARRAKYFNSEFQYDELFYKDGKWRNQWIADLSDEGPLGQYLRKFLSLTEVIGISKPDKYGITEDTVPYADWTPQQTFEVLLSQYFSRGSKNSDVQLANYNMPIFSDSPVCMFITGRRYITSAKNGTFKEQLLPKFIELVKQEMTRINRANLRKQNENYEENKIQNYDKRAGKYCFFPELNNLTIDGSTFPELAQKYLDNADIDSLDNLIERAISEIMDNLFSEYFSQINIREIEDKLDTLGVVKKDDKNKSNTKDVLDALEEYFWNSTFATSQIIQMTTTDLAFYKNPVDFQKRFKEVYASGHRLNTNSKYGRKIEHALYISDETMTSSRYMFIKEGMDDAVQVGRMKAEQRDVFLDMFKNINVADAQAFRNPYSFRAVLDMMGKWNDAMEESFQRIVHDQWDYKDINVIWQTIKPFMFTNVPTDDGTGSGAKMRVPHQNKNSEFVVLAFYDMVAAATSKSNILKGIGKFFNEHQYLDLIEYQSAVKTGGQGIVNIHTNEKKVSEIMDESRSDSSDLEKKIIAASKRANYGKDSYEDASIFDRFKAGMDLLLEEKYISQDEYNTAFDYIENSADEVYEVLTANTKDTEGKLDFKKGNYNRNTIHDLPYSDYMIAQPTPEHLMDVNAATSGSQFRNLILANIKDKENFRINLYGKELNFEQVWTLYQSSIVDNLLDKYMEAKELFEEGNIHDLQAKIFKMIEGNPKYGHDIVEALQIITIEDPLSPGTYKEVFNLPSDIPSVLNQVQELLTSIFKNMITKQKIRGGNCIQVACVGLSRQLNIIRDEKTNTIIGAECLLPASSKKFFLPFLKVVKRKNGTKYQELDVERMKAEAPELMKMIGYRIPTENKYSMLPLIIKGFLPQQNGSAIMLPADITAIAGSDFDVDKMFLRIPSFKMNDNQIPEKIHYPTDKLNTETKEATKYMDKQQRDNLMIDIEYAVLTSKEGSEQVFKPGNFETLKKDVRLLKILNNEYILRRFLTDVAGYSEDDAVTAIQENDAEIVLGALREKSFIDKEGKKRVINADTLDDFLDSINKEINSLVPQTFVYFHTQNMVGSSLIGVYANGASMHCKTQMTKLVIDDTNVFEVNSKKMRELYKVTNADNDYIQDLIAEFQGASVDNAKEQVLADLYQSMYTAGTTLFMVRVGMNLEEISLLFNAVSKYPMYSKILKSIYAKLSKNRQYKNDNEHSITSEEIVKFTMLMNKNPNLVYYLNDSSEKGIQELNKIINEKGILTSDIINLLEIAIPIFSTYEHIEDLKSRLKPVNDIMKADSPKHGIATGFAEATAQKREVDRVKVEVYSKSFPFKKEGTTRKESTMEEFVSNGKVRYNASREELRSVFMDSSLPALQAFYSLGIEFALNNMEKYFIQGSSKLGLGTRSTIGVLGDIMNNSTAGNMTPNQIKTFYREYIQYVLSTTDRFGKDFDVKRHYYLTVFPRKAKILRNKIAELKNNPVVARLDFETRNDAEASNIYYRNANKTTTEEREEIRRSLNMLLYSKDPKVVEFGIDLFMYSYYHDGLNYGPSSLGIFFDSTYWNCFPEVVNSLRTFRERYENDENFFKNFLNQWLANHSDDPGESDNIIKVYVESKDTPIVRKDDGSILLKGKGCYNRYYGGYNEYIRVKLDNGDYKLYKKAGEIKYSKDALVPYVEMPVFDEYQAVYNANKSAKDMQEFYFNDRKETLRKKKEEKEEESDSKKSSKKSRRKVENYSNIRFTTSSESNYQARTAENANWSDMTVAIAIDFDSPGEKLTKKVASSSPMYKKNYKKSFLVDKYVPISLKGSEDEIFKEGYEDPSWAFAIDEFLNRGHVDKNTPIKLNIAGNGINTLFKQKGYTQEQIDIYVFNFLSYLSKNIKIAEVRSGGQTGVDEAGVKAAAKLGIKAEVHAPGNWMFRDKDKVDHKGSKEDFIARFKDIMDYKKTDKETVESVTVSNAEKNLHHEDNDPNYNVRSAEERIKQKEEEDILKSNYLNNVEGREEEIDMEKQAIVSQMEKNYMDALGRIEDESAEVTASLNRAAGRSDSEEETNKVLNSLRSAVNNLREEENSCRGPK